MDKMISVAQKNEIAKQTNDLVQKSNSLIVAANTNIDNCRSLSMPIAQLSTLGAGVSSLLPAFRTVTKTTTIDAPQLYRLVNADVGDTLKVAKNGDLWGAVKTAASKSKMARFRPAEPLTEVTESVTAINPATIMMAVALFSVEQELGKIADMEKQIISFLEIEKEAEIEADIRTLSAIVTQYKFNWDNERYVADNHKLVLDIQRNARKNMIAFQKQVSEAIDSKKIIVAQNKVNASLNEMMKKFNYYRLSLFAFSMSSFLEVMLGGNFKEDYLSGITEEIESNSISYRELYGKASVYLEDLSNASIEANLLKGLGTAGSAVGQFIGKIPIVERGQVDEFLQESGANWKKNAETMELEAISSFASLSNPGTGVFAEKMRDMVQIYNHTEGIYFDDKMIYLVAGNCA